MSINLTRVDELFKTPATEQPYLFTPTSFKLFLMDLIGGHINGYGLNGLFQDNASYVSKAMFFPFDLSKMFNLTELQSQMWIRLGKITINGANYSYDTTHKVHQIDGLKGVSSCKWFEVNVTRTHNNFLDFAPYTKIMLQIPYFGLIDLNPIDVYKGKISVYLVIDVRSGYATIYIENVDGVIICEKTSKVAVDISIGKSNAEEIRRSNILETISVLGQVGMIASGVASGQPLVSGVGASLLTKTATETINNNITRLTSLSGSGDSRDKQAQDGTIYVIVETPKNITVPDVKLKGGVCRKNLSLSTIKGYTEIGEIHFNPMGYDIYDDEIAELNDLLRGGVHF